MLRKVIQMNVMQPRNSTQIFLSAGATKVDLSHTVCNNTVTYRLNAVYEKSGVQ